MNPIRNPSPLGAAELVARIAEAGLPPALLGAVARALFAGEEDRRAIEARRRGERRRKARSRAGAGQDATSQDVTGQDAPSREVTISPSPDKSPPHPQKLTPIPCVRDARAGGRGGGRARPGYHRLPEGWRPTRPLPPRTQAKADQWPPGAIEEELAALHRWAANAKDEAGRGRKLDWDKAWVNWIERRHDEHFRRFGPGAEGKAGHQARNGLSATTRAADRIFGSAGPCHDAGFPQ